MRRRPDLRPIGAFARLARARRPRKPSTIHRIWRAFGLSAASLGDLQACRAIPVLRGESVRRHRRASSIWRRRIVPWFCCVELIKELGQHRRFPMTVPSPSMPMRPGQAERAQPRLLQRRRLDGSPQALRGCSVHRRRWRDAYTANGLWIPRHKGPKKLAARCPRPRRGDPVPGDLDIQASSWTTTGPTRPVAEDRDWFELKRPRWQAHFTTHQRLLAEPDARALVYGLSDRQADRGARRTYRSTKEVAERAPSCD